MEYSSLLYTARDRRCSDIGLELDQEWLIYNRMSLRNINNTLKSGHAISGSIPI